MKCLLFLILAILSTCLNSQNLSDQIQLETGEDNLFDVVDTMPVYPGCENRNTLEERLECSNEKIFQHIIQETKYPFRARSKGIQGTVYLQYIVNELGNVSEIIILRGIENGEELEEEARRVIDSLPQMLPGIKGGKAVRVKYTIPIAFNLSTKRKYRIQNEGN